MSKSCINVGLMQLFNLLVPNILLYFISGISVSTSNKVFNVNEIHLYYLQFVLAGSISGNFCGFKMTI